jgi:proteasome lid subunit RPN8/RPN11
MFGPDVNAAIVAHARAEYPREACGLVLNGAYVPVDNLAENPRENFMIAVAETMRPGVQAIVHSHPDGDPWPSAEDMAGQIATALPWGVLTVGSGGAGSVLWWGPGVPRPPLIGRDFRHGPSGSDGRGDCYALIRDWFAEERGIELMEFPRADRWWSDEERLQNLYLDNFGKAGFEEIGIEEIQPGDVVLARVMSRVPNHGGIVLANGLVLHHLTHRLSRTEPLGPWMRHVTHALRYVGSPDAA